MNNYLNTQKRLFVDLRQSELFKQSGLLVSEFVERIVDQMHSTGGCSENFIPTIFEANASPQIKRSDVDSFYLAGYKIETGEEIPTALELGIWVSYMLQDISYRTYGELNSKTYLSLSIRQALASAALKQYEDNWADKYEVVKSETSYWSFNAR